MQFTAAFVLLAIAGFCHGVEHEMKGRHEGYREHEHYHKHGEIPLTKKTDVTRGELLHKTLDFFLKNPNRQMERECFRNLSQGESVDFVIDLAPSPSTDEVDKMVAESPISQHFLQIVGKEKWTPSRSYFKSVSFFIDAVTYLMKPEQTRSIIYDKTKNRKYYICGRPVDKESFEFGGDFSDSNRNLITMWPKNTKSVPTDTFLHSVLKNSLGHLTQLALWNRDNGLPTVLRTKSDLRPVYTIVITDGWSGAKLNDLVDDFERTTVIDVGNRRFLNNNNWDDLRKCVSVVALSSPQQLTGMVDSCRMLTCNLLKSEE